MTPQCEAAVPASSYRAPGRCSKSNNVKPVQAGGVKVKICRHHRAMLESGRKIIRSKP